MNHRKHHAFSDGPNDPHSPRETFGWAHWLWLFPKYNRPALGRDYVRWAGKLTQQPFYRWLESWYLFIVSGFGVLVFAAGYALGSWYLAASFLGYAFFLRMVLVLHATWLVNSLSHTHGYRNYATSDDSRNNVLVAVLALGEGWHNNHHQVQAASNHGHRRWEFDLSFAVIVALAGAAHALTWIGGRRLRPVWDVKVFVPATNRLERWFA
jgi:stearoyl-CoA desaturase (delta-9 desaturase)